MQTLSQMKQNAEATVEKVDLSMLPSFRRRLYEVGLCSKVKIKVLKISSLKKSYLIKFNDTTITIQKEFADFVFVREL